MPYVDAIEVYVPLYKNQSQEESMYRVIEKEEWEKLRNVFGGEPKWLPKQQAVYTGDYPPEAVMTYSEILEIAARIIELLPIGKMVVGPDLNFHDAEDEVLRIVQQCLYGRNSGE